MSNSKVTRNATGLIILGVSVLCWVVLLLNPGGIMGVKHCHVTMKGPSAASLDMLLAMNPFSDLMIGWTLMVLAMMLPKLITPVQYIYERSLKRKRLELMLLFIAGYTILWAGAGLLMNGIILGLNLMMPQSYIPALTVGTIALIWQFSPIKQHFLNLGHIHGPIAAFGWDASMDALRMGVKHGLWCIGSGWALMLFPMLLPQGHNLAMLAVTFVMISEHMEHPQTPRWYFSLRLKLLRIIIAQTKIKVKQALV